MNSFFGNLKNGKFYGGLWGCLDDDNTLWWGMRNGLSFGRFDENNPKVTGPKLEVDKFYIVAGRIAKGTGKVTVELFVNSPEPVAKAEVQVNPKSNPSKMAIGQERDAIQHPGKESFDGDIARFLIWEKPLTDAELKIRDRTTPIKVLPMKFFSATIICLAAAALLSNSLEANPLEATKPNIVLVMTDDQGMGDLSCMGNKVVRTPNIDRFYEKSLRFTDFQVSPTCAPTRAAMMSGRPPFMVGVTHTIYQRERMAPDVFTLPQALKSAGYTTGLFGKWHLGDEDAYLPQNRGFDEVLMHGAGGIGQVSLGDFPPNKENVYFDNVLLHNDTIVKTKGYCTDVFFDSALAWIHKKHKAKANYFAYISLNAPHAPLVAPEAYTKRFIELGYDKGTAGRYGMVENIDYNFGQLMKKLEAWNALDNTLVIFMTDNGGTHLKGTLNGKKVQHFNFNMKGAKNNPHEGGTHVPAFWQWKGKIAQGVDVKKLTAHLDLYPTFCEIAGVTLPEKMQPLDGRSLVPLLENPKADWADRSLFIHCGRWNTGKREDAKYKKCAVRTQRWRFVNNTELYDISADPGETEDVSASYPEVIQKLRKSYDKWWNEALPLMVNEGVTTERSPKNPPLAVRYEKQLAEKGIPEWAPTMPE